MALQSIFRPIYYPGLTATAAPAITADVAMTSAGHYSCAVFRAYRAMTLTHIGAYWFAATGTPTGTYTVETVDPATGLPTGTLWNATGGGSTVTTGTLVASTWDLSALAASAVISEGDVFAVKCAMASGTTLSSSKISSFGTVAVSPYQVNNTGSPAKSSPSTTKLIAIGESSSSFVPFETIMPIITVTNGTFNNTSSAKRGARFQIPFKCRAVGLRFFMNTSTGDFNALIMDDSGTDLGSTSVSVDKDQVSANAGGMTAIMFTTSAVLLPGVWYRVAIEPSSATNQNISHGTLAGANYRSAMPGGTNYFYTVYTGSWDDSQTDHVPMLDIIIDQLDDAVPNVPFSGSAQ